ncbi:uncharacterized protein HaLaN_05188 [Haematococcus lacustris]|uniref:Uncharacterized protein n=1 Tax=Haematococcus lacustris TaxID=44745 RepID=A0A699YKX1_HAELA|nr:uncharacterized protein HaLaN_05188 [Haematococcus lacustris]
MAFSTSKSRLAEAITTFGAKLREFSQQTHDEVTLIKRTAEHLPSSGALEFQDVLDDLEDEVAELSQNLQQMDRFTIDSISFEELLGHCTGLYQSNHQGLLQLQQHLQQYGYHPHGPLQQPRDPLTLLCTGKDEGSDSEGSDSLDCRPGRVHGSDQSSKDPAPHQAVKPGSMAKVKMAGAPNTPHHVMSHAASLRLSNRVKTPGMPVSKELGQYLSESALC